MPRMIWIIGLLVLLLAGAIWWWRSSSDPAGDPANSETRIAYWGRVVDSLERPVAGAQVVALEINPASDEGRTVTSRQGRFHLELPPIELPRARIFKKGYQVAVVELFPAERVGDAVDYPLFTGGSFRGRVLDPAGQPLPRLNVTLRGERGSRDEAHTNPRGEFELWGALGEAIVTVHSSRFADRREFVTLSRESSDIVPVTLEPGGSVDLYLSDDRQPIPGVEATVLTPNGDRETRRSSPEGKAVLDGLGFGRATLVLTRPGWVAHVESLSIEPGPPITRSIRMSAAPEWNLLIENEAGRAVTPRRVQLFHGSHALLETDGKPGSLDVLDPSRTYRLIVEADGYATRTTQIRLDAAPDRVLTLRLERGTEVRGEVQDGRGNPLAGARLTIIDGQQRAFTPEAMSIELRTTGDGRFRSPALAAGRYRTRVSPQDGPEWEVAFEVPRNAGDTATLEPWRP